MTPAVRRRQRAAEWLMLCSAITLLAGSLIVHFANPTQVALARFELGGENIVALRAEVLDAWVHPPADWPSTPPLRLEASWLSALRGHYDGSGLQRQLQHAAWIEHFLASENVGSKYKTWLNQGCTPDALRAEPLQCHHQLAVRLTNLVTQGNWWFDRGVHLELIGFSFFGLGTLLFGFWLWRDVHTQARNSWSELPHT